MELNDVLTTIKDGKLDTLSPEELQKACDILHESKHYKELAIVADALSKAENSNTGKKGIEINKYSEQATLDEESKKALNNLVVVNDNGQSVDVKEEIIETAKINVAVNQAENPSDLTQQSYNEALHQEIANIMSTILASQSSLKHNEDNVNEANKMADNVSDLYSGKTIKVSKNSFVAAISAHLSASEKKAKTLEEKSPAKGFFANIKNRIQKVDESLTSKFETYKRFEAMLKG